jgi:AsmA protein
MKIQNKIRLLKGLKITGITITVILFLLFILPILFPQAITNKVKAFANEKLNGELSFKETNLSFFTHFPSLTLTLDEFLLKGSAPFEKDTLVSAKEIAFGINVKSIFFGDKLKIDKIYLSEGLINVKVNKNGQPNYNVYVSESNKKTSDSTSASIQLERIDIKKVRLLYDDKSTKILIKAKELNYLGKGDLYASIFDLKTKAQIQGFDFTFDNEEYLKNKMVNAELVTKINTNSLSLLFQENNLKINKLPVDFKGKFDFLKNGYDLDFTVKSENSQLNDFFTALPPQFVTWLSKTSVKGKTDLLFTLKGKYIAEENRKPNVHFNMKIREGFVAYNKSPIAAENIFLNFDTKLNSLDTEQLELKIDSIYFDVGKDFFNGNIKWKGMANPDIDARIRSKLDLAKLDQAIGIENMILKGIFSADIVSKGKYIKDKNQFPVTEGDLELKNGFIQSSYYPNPITNINCKAKAINQTGKLKDLSIQLSPASFSFENKPFALVASFKDFDDINYDIKANGELDIERMYKVFSQKGLNVTGYAKMDLALKGKQSDATSGRYANLQNSGALTLKKIKINSEFLPLPFVIEEGDFSFYQDKMNFTNFKATYGKSDFKMNGYMENVINFALSENQVLKGNFKVESDFIQVNEFLTLSGNTNIEEQSTTEFGVVVIPSQFDFTREHY